MDSFLTCYKGTPDPPAAAPTESANHRHSPWHGPLRFREKINAKGLTM